MKPRPLASPIRWWLGLVAIVTTVVVTIAHGSIVMTLPTLALGGPLVGEWLGRRTGSDRIVAGAVLGGVGFNATMVALAAIAMRPGAPPRSYGTGSSPRRGRPYSGSLG